MQTTDKNKQQGSVKEPKTSLFDTFGAIFAPISQNDLGSITPNPFDDKRNFGIVSDGKILF